MSIVSLLLIGFLVWTQHRAWTFHKQGEYDQAAMNFGIMLMFLWAGIGSTFGPLTISEQQTVTVPISIGFGALYIVSVLTAVWMAWNEWRGQKDVSYTCMLILFVTLTISAVWRFIDLTSHLPTPEGG